MATQCPSFGCKTIQIGNGKIRNEWTWNRKIGHLDYVFRWYLCLVLRNNNEKNVIVEKRHLFANVLHIDTAIPWIFHPLNNVLQIHNFYWGIILQRTEFQLIPLRVCRQGTNDLQRSANKAAAIRLTTNRLWAFILLLRYNTLLQFRPLVILWRTSGLFPWSAYGISWLQLVLKEKHRKYRTVRSRERWIQKKIILQEFD